MERSLGMPPGCASTSWQLQGVGVHGKVTRHATWMRIHNKAAPGRWDTWKGHQACHQDAHPHSVTCYRSLGYGESMAGTDGWD
eukprot:1160730-Pelagomonas_calceolata.AAC.6